MDVGRLVARAARRYPSRIAVEGPDGTRTFAELGDRLARLARGLLSLGLQPGDRVLDLQTNQVSYLETDLGISTAGLCRVALNYRLHPNDWQAIAADCGARALIYDARFTDQTEALRSELGGRTLVIGDGPGIPYEHLIGSQSGGQLLIDADPDALVSLNYSSGTTGRPKGAMRTHRNRLASLTHIVTDVLPTRPDRRDCWVHAGPITHTSGLFVLTYLAFGARQLILPAFDPHTLVEAIEHRGGTATALVPTMVARLLGLPELPDRSERSEHPMSGLRFLGYAGAPMPPEQIRAAYARISPALVQYYGLVEAIPPVTVLDPEDHARGIGANGHPAEPHLLGSAGRPCLAVELQIVDDAGRPLPDGEIGEVVTRGDHVMPGYWGRADDPAAGKTIRDGWLHTGDLGRLDADGHLYLVDRKGDMIISGGYNIYPREVEDAIAEIPGVHQVAVVGLDDPEWGQRVAAAYSLHAGAVVTPDQVLAHCRARLAGYKKPKLVRELDALPLNSTGKIAKRQVRDLLAELVPRA
ncbi:MAG TPA: AMP-binding protein [Actinomycetes bacterium]|jgi:acyl-CoA synthetase (AMP-forming)/AMP-acid ligase II|nr:AMP-binding protein [Actinomycetes bacterium]